MKKDKKKLAHIDIKDNGLIVSAKVGDILSNSKMTYESELLKGLIKGSNETSLLRYKILQNINLKAFQLKVDKLTQEAKKAVKNTLNKDKTVNLTPNQVAAISTTINKGLVFLQNNAVQTYQRTLNDMYLKVKSATDLKDQLQKHINSGLNLGVVYQNGREYQFDTYFEMKARTDIQVDIKDNLVDSGREAGIIFYITSYYGDCAKDHAEWQGKIYVDDEWDSIAPKDRIDEINSYIKSNDIKTVKYITEGDVKLTTRPNCRHYFMPIGIDEVLGAKTEKDVNKLREERNLNFNGKYKPEKYEALQKQRLNERKIRAEKKEINTLESELALHPENYKKLQSEILLRQDRVSQYQADQRALIKQYNNLERRYDREALGNRVTLGAEKSQDLTFKSNEGKINIEIDEKTPCLIKQETNEIISTSFEEVDYKKYSGFKFNWSIKETERSKLEALYANGDNRIQGLMSYRVEKKDKAIYVELVESAHHNNGFYLKNSFEKEYLGVGAHLFAQAVKHSYEEGFNGFIYFKPKTRLIEYYQKELGATAVNKTLMFITEDKAKDLFIKYYGEEEFKKYESNNKN